jgi:protoporphyrinogen IX oxidase
MLLIKALHIIFMTSWMAGLLYLPRLFVYHSTALDDIGHERFVIMERKLFYYITTPAAILTTIFGSILVYNSLSYYMTAMWLHLKVFCVLLLWVFHLYCGYFVKIFALRQNKHAENFFRFFNEIPAVLLVIIVILVVLKPYG